MKRDIYCERCGVLKPMHPKDVVNGLQRRRVHIRLSCHCNCEGCTEELNPGDTAIAETNWYKSREGTPGDWEQEYGNPI